MMEKKKHPPIHEGLIKCLESPYASSMEIALITRLYGEQDSECPATAIPVVIAALESRLKRSPGLKDIINMAIASLEVQFKTKQLDSEKKPGKPEVAEIVKLVTENFRCFGGGTEIPTNPISAALKDSPPVFAGGVDIEAVVRFIIAQVE